MLLVGQQIAWEWRRHVAFRANVATGPRGPNAHDTALEEIAQTLPRSAIFSRGFSTAIGFQNISPFCTSFTRISTFGKLNLGRVLSAERAAPTCSFDASFG
jgi:hypothetical protein